MSEKEDLTTLSDEELTWLSGDSRLDVRKRLEFQRRERWHAVFAAAISRAGRSWLPSLVVSEAKAIADHKYGEIPDNV